MSLARAKHFAMLKSPNYILAPTFMKTRSVNINLLTMRLKPNHHFLCTDN